MKIIALLLSLLIILVILPSFSQVTAEPTISIETSQNVYAYGDHLNIIINVSEITGDDARIYIINTEERKSLLLQQPISQKYTEFPSPFPIESGSPVWLTGTYGLEFEYSGAKSSTQFTLEDSGQIGLPFWIKDVAKMWVTDQIAAKEFSVAIEYMINSGIIKIPYTETDDNVSATTIPDWVKNTAGWWASDQIPDSAFLQGIQFLIKEGIMVIPSTETSGSSQSQEVPTWVKNNAGWWAEDKISEIEFVNAIQYLIKHGIIVVNYSSSCANDLSEIFGDSNAILQDICDSHESTEYSELVPAANTINYNSLGFRGAEFSEVKAPNTYRIFLVGGSTMIGSGATGEETTKSGILQKMFDSDNSVQNIEVINGAFFGANSATEFDLVTQKLVNYQPDLIILFDGLNDLKADYPGE